MPGNEKERKRRKMTKDEVKKKEKKRKRKRNWKLAKCVFVIVTEKSFCRW